MKIKVCLTGYSGFIGSNIRQQLSSDNLLLLGRNQPILRDGEVFQPFDLMFEESSLFHKKDQLEIDVIIHAAARVHVMNDNSINPLQAFREANTYGTLNLAQKAAKAGVKRFIFISSIKVNGESTEPGFPFKPLLNCVPNDPYGLSKYEAEVGLREISIKTGMEIVIIRPTLVYGPGVKGNFHNLLKLSTFTIPLPFGSINNKRSMVYLGNLVDLIITCIDHHNAANRIFLASDGDDLSLSGLLTKIRIEMKKAPLLIRMPSGIFRSLGKLFRKKEIVDRLIGNLQVDNSNTKVLLNWTAPHSVEVGIKATVDDFLENQRRL
jgi:nucleoside-diphosphate-sugar epimerase